MKTLRFVGMAFFAILMCVNLASCSNSDEDEFKLTGPYATKIIGTWEITHYGDGKVWIPWTNKTTTATFNSDGRYSGRGYFGTGTGTFELSNSHITCYIEGEVFMQYDIVSVEGDVAILTMYPKSSSDKLTIKSEKQ